MPSYGSDADLIAYLAETGRALPVDAVPAQVRAMGTMWVDSLEDLYCGTALSFDNSFPRDMYDPTPTRVEEAAYEAGLAWADGDPIFGGGGTAGGQVVEERVDVLSIKYATPTGSWWDSNRYFIPLAYSKLLPFLCIPDEDDGKCMPGLGGGFIV